jgi:outer membrane biosynthesis protein TonB
MKSWSVIIAGFVFCSAITFAQEPAHPGQVFSSDLVLWSSMQEPQQPEQDHPHQQPTPEPNPETQPAPNPTPSQPGQQHASPATPESQNKSAIAQTFTGTISKEADNYVLKVSDSTSYKLDSQDQVQQFEGKRVQVTGTLDSSINLIHVDKVEPIS